MRHSPNLDALARHIRELEAPDAHAPRRLVPTGFADASLPCGVVHEWFGSDDCPPLIILAHLARQSLIDRPGPGHHVAFIGRHAWPYPHTLIHAGDRRLVHQSIWLDPRTDDERLWAIDQAMSCPAIAAVVADGSGLPMAATRRLQLAARNSGALVMLARPQRDRGVISAAALRWVVTPTLSPGTHPRWIIELARAKGQSLTATGTRWIVEKTREEGLVHLPAALCDRPAEAAPAPQRRTA